MPSFSSGICPTPGNKSGKPVDLLAPKGMFSTSQLSQVVIPGWAKKKVFHPKQFSQIRIFHPTNGKTPWNSQGIQPSKPNPSKYIQTDTVYCKKV